MVSKLRNDIISGAIAPGKYLPSETALGEQYQLSKNSVRIGLDLLVAEKLIEKVPRVGNRIRTPASEGVVTIRMGYHPLLVKDIHLNQLVSAFHSRYPHIRVRLIPLPYENYADTARDAFMDDELDVVSVNHLNFLHLVENGALSAMEPIEQDPGLYFFLTQAFTEQGVTYVKPVTFSPVILCYNKLHFIENHVSEPDSSWSWKDLQEQARVLSDGNDRFGFYFHLLSDNRWPIFMLQSGAHFSGDERNGICTPELKRGLSACRDLVYNKEIFPTYLSENDSDAESLFLKGKVSMIMTTYFSLNALREAKFPFEIAPLPYLNQAKTLLLSIGLGVSKQSKAKQAVQEFVQYFVSYEAQLYIRQHTLSLPSMKRAAEWQGKELFYRPSRFHLYRDIMPTFALFSELGLGGRKYTTLSRELKLFWSRMEELEDVCARLQEGL
jgi:multiple sugar transport system substrate-binding protein